MDKESKSNTFSFVVTVAEDGRRLDQFLTAKLNKRLSRNGVQKIIRENGVLLNGEMTNEINYKMREGDKINFDLPAEASRAPRAENIPLNTVFEDDHLLVIDKPRGMVVHPGAGNHSGTLVHALIGASIPLSDIAGEDRPGIVHRLDKETSGLIMIAKTNKAHMELTEQLSSRLIAKTYAALVHGSIEFEEGEIDEPIGRDSRSRVKMAVCSDGKQAITRFKVMKRFQYSSFLHVYLITGRTHQIRVHMSYMKHPVLGDMVYGLKQDKYPLALHAMRLELSHPITKESLALESALPEDFERLLKDQEQRKLD